MEQALQLKYTKYYPPLEEIECDLLGTLPVNIDMMIQKALTYARENLSKEQDLVFLHKDFSGNNLAFNETTGQIIGVFDFSDAAIGPYSWEFGHLFSTHAELVSLTAEIYANMNNVPNPLVGGAADYILRKATLILEARRKGNLQDEMNLLKELCDFIPIWHDALDDAVEN